MVWWKPCGISRRAGVIISRGLPNEDLGQRVHAIVDAPDGVTDEALLAHLAERLVRYKIPQSFEYVSAPLRDDDGKVRRSAPTGAAAHRHWGQRLSASA